MGSGELPTRAELPPCRPATMDGSWWASGAVRKEKAMEHKPLVELNALADLKPAPRAPMSRRERLDRWAELLEGEPDRLLKTLEEIEWKPKAARLAMRADGSPLAVAFADPGLRTEGLARDRLGEPATFFG